MVKVTTEDGKIILSSKFDKTAIEGYKKLGGRWNKIRQAWVFPDTWVNQWGLSRIHQDEIPPPDGGNPGVATFFTPPAFLMPHQAAAVEISKTTPRYAFFDDTGVGKTLESLIIASAHKVKALVLCPWATIQDAWIGDAEKFTPELKVINLWMLNKKRDKNMLRRIADADVACLTHDSVGGMFDILVNAGFGMLIIDESSKLKNPKATRTKIITLLASVIPRVYILSGSPAPNDFSEYFPQVALLDPLLWGVSFYKWRTENFVQSQYEIHKYRINKSKEPGLLADLRSISRAVQKKDVLTLPERAEQIWRFTLDKAEMKAYAEMKEECKASLFDDGGNVKGGITAANVGVAIIKLRQVISGFLLDDTKSCHSLGTSKLTSLLELLELIGPHQTIICTQFQMEAVFINDSLPSSCICNGTITDSKKVQSIEDFKSGKIQYMIAHPRSLGHGVTLVNSTYSVYYSSSYSWEERKQSMDRNFRKGQENSVTVYDMLTDKLIDTVIFKCLQRKEDAASAVLGYLRS